MPHGVIFDLDGVLVESGPPHVESWRVLARQYGIDMPDELFAKTFGMTSREIIRKVWGAHLDAAEVRRIDDEKERVYRELIKGQVPLSPGVHEMLAGLAGAGYVLALATSGPPQNAELVLGEGGIAEYFRVAINGFDVEHGKPAPDIFLLAARRAGLEAADCVVVEDAPVGIQAAHAAGMRVIGYVGTHPAERLQAAGVDEMVERLTEIKPERVAALLNRSVASSGG